MTLPVQIHPPTLFGGSFGVRMKYWDVLPSSGRSITAGKVKIHPCSIVWLLLFHPCLNSIENIGVDAFTLLFGGFLYLFRLLWVYSDSKGLFSSEIFCSCLFLCVSCHFLHHLFCIIMYLYNSIYALIVQSCAVLLYASIYVCALCGLICLHIYAII